MKRKLKGLAQAIRTAAGTCNFKEPGGVIRKKPAIITCEHGLGGTAHANVEPVGR